MLFRKRSNRSVRKKNGYKFVFMKKGKMEWNSKGTVSSMQPYTRHGRWNMMKARLVASDTSLMSRVSQSHLFCVATSLDFLLIVTIFVNFNHLHVHDKSVFRNFYHFSSSSVTVILRSNQNMSRIKKKNFLV